MAKNLELKSRIRSIADAEAAASACGATFRGTLHQSDTYFDVPRGRLKLREIDGEEAELIFYERPEDRPERWSNYERISCADPARLKAALGAALGIRVVVKKTRRLYQYHRSRIHIDTVEGLGTFLEFEVQDSDAAESEALMKLLRNAFAVRGDDIVRASYADLVYGKNNLF